jgi:hypothetical protein
MGKGYVQQVDISFAKVFASVARMESICLVLALMVNEG